MRGEETERRRREDLDFSTGSEDDTEGLRRRLGGVRERVSGEDEAERLRRESLVFLVSSDDREPRRRGGVRDLVFGSGDNLELLLAALDLGGCSGEDSELLLPSGEGPLPLLEDPDLLRLGRARDTGTLGSGEESEALCALAAALGFSCISGDEPERLRLGEGRDLLSTSGEDPE